MSNKTSDKNVANIEDDVKIVKRYLENSAYKESNSDFFKNGGWEIVDLEIPRAMKNIIAEREQDKKRIQELEEERKKYIVQLTDEQYRNLVDTIRREVRQELEQKVKDKIEKYNKKMEEDAGHPNWVVTDRIVMNVLQELLEGGK